MALTFLLTRPHLWGLEVACSNGEPKYQLRSKALVVVMPALSVSGRFKVRQPTEYNGELSVAK